MPGALLVPVGAVDPALMGYLTLVVAEVMGSGTRTAERSLSPDRAFDPRRRQYDSTEILGMLEREFGSHDGKVLGVAEVDLFIPILTFVFGEAQLSGRFSIISLARLRSSFYGMEDDAPQLYRRAEKEAIHELGHTLGLVHCDDYGCVMRFSSSVEEVDLKGDRFCERCSAAVRSGAGRG